MSKNKNSVFWIIYKTMPWGSKQKVKNKCLVYFSITEKTFYNKLQSEKLSLLEKEFLNKLLLNESCRS